MKVRLKFKTPDVFDQLDEATDEQIEAIKELIARFVKYGELVVIEFDTLTQSAKVVEAA